MILQALKEYYDRKAADPESGIAPQGWEKKEIPFIITIDDEGGLIQIEDTREGEGKKRRARTFLVPQGVKRANAVVANLLWDNPSYIFGIDLKGKPERALEQKAAFIERIEKQLANIKEVVPVIRFLKTITIERLQKEASWAEILDKNLNLTFRIVNKQILVCQEETVKSALLSGSKKDLNEGFCLVTGRKSTIATLHPSLKGVLGAQSSGANIVSFNLDAFRSFNKIQGLNAPVGESAVFAYTTAINTLLSKDSDQRLIVGDSTVIFWSEKKTRFESDFSIFFSEPRKDDPDEWTSHAKALFDSINNGAYYDDESTIRFYILGLAPNAARIAIRLWQVGTIAEFAQNIRGYFHDCEIIKPPNEPEHYSLWRLLVNIAAQDKSENIPPNLAGDVMHSILTGSLFPATLLQAALRRIRSDAENRIKPVRAALIKAYLNRYHRVHPSTNHKEILMGLDAENPSLGYQLGRLFAVLEKCQKDALGNINSTIVDRYYSSASATPSTVFPILLRMNQHHLSKLGDSPVKYANRKRIESIMGQVGDFKPHLDLHEQGRFALGYYHQRQDFFSKN
ncbi:MAG: type I-C CRISPR-associated protein Cas8c/Csd1 [Chitinivibrionales bacterium]|nr:type I-C CRISPR-associated protein Cas8c/Csd1 [Chitinivibrionales bacterium]